MNPLRTKQAIDALSPITPKVSSIIPWLSGLDIESTTQAFTNNTTAYFSYVDFLQPIDANSITMEIPSVTTASTLEFALYSEDGQTQIFSQTSTTPSSGTNKFSLDSQVEIAQGRYIMAVVPTSSPVNMNNWVRSIATSGYPLDPSGDNVMFGTKTVTAGALPSTIDMTTLTVLDKAFIFRFDT